MLNWFTMLQRLVFVLVSWATLWAQSEHAQAYIAADRWNRTATNPSTGSWGDPVTLTWSLAPDGTDIPGNGSGSLDSNLLNFLDSNFGVGAGGDDLRLRPWFPIFDLSFARLSALSGLTFVYDTLVDEPTDDGRAFSNTTSARGSLGVRGDIRIGGKSFGSGSNTLAANFSPDYGEMMINTDKQSFYTNRNNTYRGFRNTVMHEVMHGIGISHVESSSSAFLIEPFISTDFDGPQLDDLLAIQRLYGDVHEKNGGNDTFDRATPLGQLTPGSNVQRGSLGDSTVIGGAQVDFLSIDDSSDRDVFSFTVGSRLDLQMSLIPRGTTYQVGPQGGTQSAFDTLTLSNLSLELLGSDGTSVLKLANSAPAGVREEVNHRLSPGTYFARVRGDQSDIQLYGLNLLAMLPAPQDLFWVGNLSGNWDVETTANFASVNGPTVFYASDNVTFTDSASRQMVNLPVDIAAGHIRVTTATGYVFEGTGGIVAGSLTLDGAGEVELANSGNSYSGATEVLSGTLRITGDANAMVTAITVASGAQVIMDATDAAAMSSSFTIDAGAVLQIGTMESSGNVFPDAPGAVLNEGTIRVLDAETLTSIAGGGDIVVEAETASLASNTFSGQVVVKPAAIARVTGAMGLGSGIGSTIVEAGGALVLNTDATFDDAMNIAGDGMGFGAVQIESARSVSLTGEVMLASSSTIRAAENAVGTFSGGVSAAESGSQLSLDVAIGGTLSFTGAIDDIDAGIDKQGLGTAELTGPISYTGTTRVRAGTLRLAGSGDLAGEHRVDDGATLEIEGAHLLQATSSITGDGQISGSLLMPGTIDPGESIGQLAFTDNLSFTDSTSLNIQLGGTLATEEYDVLSIEGVASLDGYINISLVDGFEPQESDEFELITADAGVLGSFDETVLPPLAMGLAWNLVYNEFAVLLQAISEIVDAIPGDFNDDGSVDAADYVLWRKHDGTQSKYETWLANFDSTGAGSRASTSSVPEPAAALILFWAVATLYCSRLRAPRGSLTVRSYYWLGCTQASISETLSKPSVPGRSWRAGVELQQKRSILADAAKFDASCASSGAKTPKDGSQLGSTEGMAICHSYTPTVVACRC